MILKKSIRKFIKPSANSILNSDNPKEVKLITTLRLGLGHLRKHKFQHSFQDLLNRIYNCELDINPIQDALTSVTHIFVQLYLT